VDFAADPTNGLVPLIVVFTNLSTGTVSGQAWTFGDGKASTEVMPSNTFSNTGLFSVTLTAWNSGGTNSLTRTNYVIVTNLPPPVPQFVAGPTNGLEPLHVGFTNFTLGNVSSYVWDFGDGSSSEMESPDYTYTNAGSYTIGLTAIGPGGTNTIILTNYIVVTNPPLPAVNFVADTTNGMAPLTVNFTNLTTGALTYDWTFGDSNSSSAVDPVNTFTNAGIYSITLMAIGPGGASALTLTNYVVVTNPPPPAVDFVADVTNGVAPLTVNFTNLSTGALTYDWTFGDENSSSEANPLNTYTNAGVYSVTLTATGPGGITTLTLTNYVLVTNPPPPDVNFVADYTNGVAPLAVNFTNQTTGAFAYEWILGDGHSTTNENPAYTYANAGNYAVTLTAMGAGGTNSVTVSNFITVLAPARLLVIPEILDLGFILTGATAQAEFVLSNSGAIHLSGMASLSSGPFHFLDDSSNIVLNSSFEIAAFNSTNIPIFFSSVTQASSSNVVVFASNGGDVTNVLVGQALSPPVLLPPGLTGNDFIFSFLSLQGRTYLIQYKEFLTDPSWQDWETVPGNGSAVFITNLISTNAQRFFRLSVE
jgi:PKD repeat protein